MAKLTPKDKREILWMGAGLVAALLAFVGLIVFAITVVAPYSQNEAVKFQQESVHLVSDTYDVEVVSSNVHGWDYVTEPNTITIKKDGKELVCSLPDRPAIEKHTPLRGCEPAAL